MNSLISVLQPSPAARVVHARLAAVLECSTHHLLNARADVWEPGEEPEPKPMRKVSVAKVPSAPVVRATEAIFAVLGDRPMGTRQVVKATGIKYSTVGNMLAKLVKSGRVRNLSRTGMAGQYVRAITVERGVFDV